MFEGTGLTALDLYQDSQASLKNKMANFDEADPQKAYDLSQGKDDETVRISSGSCQIGRKFQSQEKAVSPPGLNIEPDKDPSIT